MRFRLDVLKIGIGALIALVICLIARKHLERPNDLNSESHLLFDSAALEIKVLNISLLEAAQAELQCDTVLLDAEKDSLVFRKTVSFLRNYWSYPNSRFRNENLWMKTLEHAMESVHYLPAEQDLLTKEWVLVQQNSVGRSANDFKYVNPAGNTTSMSSHKREFTLLLFYNPDCPACMELKTGLVNSTIIKSYLKNKMLTLLAIYPDADLELWRKHLPEYPSSWIMGRNNELHDKGTYNLQAIPSMYLLDKDKIVILKDAQLASQIEMALERN